MGLVSIPLLVDQFLLVWEYLDCRRELWGAMGNKTKKKVLKPKAANPSQGLKPKSKHAAHATRDPAPTTRKAEPRPPLAAPQPAAPPPPPPPQPAVHPPDAEELPRRKLGIRGAAPWAARHAAKHAAEARARAAVPPPPGSARATIRVPTGAEEIKAKIVDLHNSLNEIRSLRKNLAHNFFEVGLVLRDILARKLYEARGFGTFEGFLEREVDLGKVTSMRLVRATEVFTRDAALEYGMDRVVYVLNILEAPDKPTPAASSPTPASGTPKTSLPLRPPLPGKK